MVRPNCKHASEPAVALYMPMIREHCDLTTESERQFKLAVKDLGGENNKSGLFLSTTSKAATVSKATGINRRSVTFIPRAKIDKDLLERFDMGIVLTSCP